MQGRTHIEIPLNGLLYGLFCFYAFSLPFELLFYKLLGIDTIFKPFRILSLGIIGVYFLRFVREGIKYPTRQRFDLLLYLVFAYGLIITLINIIGGRFSMGLFLNDSFQVGLHLLVFFIFKVTPLEEKQALTIFKFFIAGIVLNSLYMFVNLLGIFYGGRHSGFVDNPNYASLGIAMGLSGLLLDSPRFKSSVLWLGTGMVIAILLISFAATGSRAGLIVFLVSLMYIIFISSFRKKLRLAGLGLLLLLFILPGQLQDSSALGSLSMIKRVSAKLGDEVEDVRFTVWRGVFRALESEGYAGMGIGQFKSNFTRYYGEESNWLILKIVNRGYYLSTHNDYLALLTDYGLPGLFFYLLFLSFVGYQAFMKLRIGGESRHSWLLNLQFLIILCLVVFGMAAENFQHPLFWFLLMFGTKYFNLSDPFTSELLNNSKRS